MDANEQKMPMPSEIEMVVKNKSVNDGIKTVHDGIKTTLGRDVHFMVMECSKALIAHDISEDGMIQEYTYGGTSGYVEAILYLDGYYTCEYTGTTYERAEVEDSIEDFQRELARNATHFERISAFNKLDAKLGGPSDDNDYMFVGSGDDNDYVFVEPGDDLATVDDI
jgi:hypothetical protein